MTAWRYYAQRIRSGLWLDRDLAIYEPKLSWALAGPGTMSFKVDPITAKTLAPDNSLVLDEWSTAIYAEANNQIRWGGIVHSSVEGDSPGSRDIECISFSGYAKGRLYDGPYYFLWQPDVFDMIRLIWNFIQTTPGGNLGMLIDSNKAGLTLGDPGPGPAPQRSSYKTTEAWQEAQTAWTNYPGQAYELAWWDQKDCGDEIDSICQETGAEFTEVHSWADSGKNTVTHRLDLGTPKLGSRRTDLRFVEGENIAVPPKAQRNGDNYANTVYALGAGEERFMLREIAGYVEPTRLRRDKVISMKDVMRPTLLKAAAEEELTKSRDMVYFDSFQAYDHPNAPFNSWGIGDEIRVQTFSGFEKLDRWVRVTEISINPEESDIIDVSVVRV